MFKISVAKKDEFEDFKNYMDYSSNGIMLICREEGKITGGICFDLFEKGAIIQKMKTDEEAMREIMVKSALNFLDLTRVYDVYINDTDEKIYKLLSFTGRDDDVADPWYSGDFETTYRDIYEGCEALLKYVRC